MFKILSNKEYTGLYDKIDRLTEDKKQLKKMLADKEEIIRTIIRIIRKLKQTQNYGSVINTLNKVETEIMKSI